MFTLSPNRLRSSLTLMRLKAAVMLDFISSSPTIAFSSFMLSSKGDALRLVSTEVSISFSSILLNQVLEGISISPSSLVARE